MRASILRCEFLSLELAGRAEGKSWTMYEYPYCFSPSSSVQLLARICAATMS
jgi:hypothetical protein